MLNFFNSTENSEKFIIVHPSEVSLYELHEKDHETDFIYDTPRLQNLSKTEKSFLISSFTHFAFSQII